MKLNKIILLAVLPVFFACEVENMGTVYTPEGTSEISFEQEKIYNHVLKDDATVFNIPIIRNVVKEEATIHIEEVVYGKDENGKTVRNVISTGRIPASVTFAAGEATANIPVDIADIPVGDAFKGTLEFAKADKELYNSNLAITAVTFDIAKDYVWESIGQGEFFDGWWYEEAWDEVEFVKAKGFSVYRALNPYEKAKDANTTAKKPEFFEFTIDPETGAATFKTFATPVEYAGGVIYAYWPSDFNADKYGAYEAYSGVYDEEGYFVLFAPVWYIEPNVGGWGAQPYTLGVALPGAPKDFMTWYNEE